jgi:hypothetical protein
VVDSERVERTLALTRAHFRAPVEARARVQAALLARGNAGASSLLVEQRAAGVSKAAATLLAGLTFVAGFWLGGQRASAPAPKPPASALAPTYVAPGDTAVAVAQRAQASPAHAQPAPLDEAAHAAPVAALELEATKPRRTLQQGPAAARRRAEPEGSFPGELALLQRAERAIRSGEPELALGFLDELERRYPKTRFVEERAAARLLAGCARAEAEARAQAEVFVRERSSSVYSDRLRELCKLESAPAARDGKRSPGH